MAQPLSRGVDRHADPRGNRQSRAGSGVFGGALLHADTGGSDSGPQAVVVEVVACEPGTSGPVSLSAWQRTLRALRSL
jgi:hypothetical protein